MFVGSDGKSQGPTGKDRAGSVKRLRPGSCPDPSASLLISSFCETDPVLLRYQIHLLYDACGKMLVSLSL